MTLPSSLRDAVLLVTRVILGVVLMAHGWQKFVTNGLSGTTAAFEKMGVPLPGPSAAVAGAIELGGGLLLVLGALTAVAGVLIAADMAGAFLIVHRDGGVFVTNGGWELVAVIAAAALTFAAVGPGRLSIDHVLTGRRRRV